MVSRFRVSAYTCPAIIFSRFINARDAFEHNPHHPTLTRPQLKKVVLQLFLRVTVNFIPNLIKIRSFSLSCFVMSLHNKTRYRKGSNFN